VAALGIVSDPVLVLNALVAGVAGRQMVRVSRSGTVDAAEALGKQLAQEAVAHGAEALLVS
jgi:porphobilinogen deaminase